MARYAAKLLFQFRVDIDGDPGKRRLCEERIIHFEAGTPKECLRIAKRHGKNARFRYKNTEGNPVTFEFIGVMDVLKIGLEFEPNEVWYEMSQKLTPMERRAQFIPSDEVLLQRAK